MKATRIQRDFCYAYDFLFTTEAEQLARKAIIRSFSLSVEIPRRNFFEYNNVYDKLMTKKLVCIKKII
jgi:hypothetical protein